VVLGVRRARRSACPAHATGAIDRGQFRASATGL